MSDPQESPAEERIGLFRREAVEARMRGTSGTGRVFAMPRGLRAGTWALVLGALAFGGAVGLWGEVTETVAGPAWVATGESGVTSVVALLPAAAQAQVHPGDALTVDWEGPAGTAPSVLVIREVGGRPLELQEAMRVAVAASADVLSVQGPMVPVEADLPANQPRGARGHARVKVGPRPLGPLLFPWLGSVFGGPR